jgi:hypothetical protein
MREKKNLTSGKNYPVTEIEHFKGKSPHVLKAYKKLIASLHKFGPIKIEPKKTSIHLVNRFGFAGVYPRQDYINIEVHLNYKLQHERVGKIEQASANRYHHTIKLNSELEVDKELLIWLREAYDLKK